MKNSEIIKLFKFSDSDAKDYINRKLRLTKKIKQSFQYLTSKMKPQKIRKDLGELKWEEGKNYDWAYVVSGSAEFIIRKYSRHFTIFTRNTVPKDLGGGDIIKRSNYSCFTFNTDNSKLTDKESDLRCDRPFIDLNVHINRLVEVVQNDKVGWLWNSASHPREEYVEIKNVYDGDHISDVNLLLFACDEICEKYFQHFSESETLQALNNFKTGDVFTKDFHGDVIITDIKTEVKDDYYHAVGLQLKSANEEVKFEDVYSLTRWYYNEMFPEILPERPEGDYTEITKENAHTIRYNQKIFMGSVWGFVVEINVSGTFLGISYKFTLNNSHEITEHSKFINYARLRTTG